MAIKREKRARNRCDGQSGVRKWGAVFILCSSTSLTVSVRAPMPLVHGQVCQSHLARPVWERVEKNLGDACSFQSVGHKFCSCLQMRTTCVDHNCGRGPHSPQPGLPKGHLVKNIEAASLQLFQGPVTLWHSSSVNMETSTNTKNFARSSLCTAASKHFINR